MPLQAASYHWVIVSVAKQHVEETELHRQVCCTTRQQSIQVNRHWLSDNDCQVNINVATSPECGQFMGLLFGVCMPGWGAAWSVITCFITVSACDWLQAVAVTFVKFFLEPAGHIGEALNHLVTAAFDDLPFYLWLPVFSLLVLLIVLVMFFVFGYRVRGILEHRASPTGWAATWAHTATGAGEGGGTAGEPGTTETTGRPAAWTHRAESTPWWATGSVIILLLCTPLTSVHTNSCQKCTLYQITKYRIYSRISRSRV